MAVGPWIGLGVAYGLSVRSLLRQGRESRADNAQLRIIHRSPDLRLEALQAPRASRG